MKLVAVLLWLGGMATAQEFVDVSGPLSDEAFYRAVACAAAPGAPCRKPYLRWPAEKRGALTVALAPFPDDVPPERRALYDDGLDSALAQIDGIDAGITLTRATGPADIELHIVDTRPGEVMRGTGVSALEGQLLPLGRVALRARGGEIRAALVAVSAHARPQDIASVLLEEIVQSLGLMTDLRGSATIHSLFSEEANFVTRLQGQDAMALRRHYAPSVP